MTNLPSISFVTPSFNQARFIRDTIESILALGLVDFEHIIIDGGSTDGTVEILKEYPHLTWVSERDKGQSDAINKGLARARNEIIGWINSDDFYLPGGGVVRALKHFAEHPETGLVNGNKVHADEAGRITERDPPKMRVESLRRPWISDTGVFQPGTLFRRIVYERHGPIGQHYHYAMDYDFFLRASAEFQIYPLPCDIAAQRIYGATKTSQGWQNFSREIEKVLRDFHLARCERWAARYAPWRVHLHDAHVWLMQSLEAEVAGDLAAARELRARAIRRNPGCLFSYPHLCFRLRQLIGPARYDILRERFAKGTVTRKTRP